MILYLFDIDGTLLHAHRAGSRAFDAVFAAQHGLERATEGIRFGGKTDPGLIDEIFVARLGRRGSAPEHAAFLDAYLQLLRTSLTGTGVEVLGGVVETLTWLAARPEVMLGIATGNVRAGADAKLAAAGLDRYFARGPLDALGGYGCDSHVRAELVAAAIGRGRRRGAVDEVVVVGDTIHDISAARACGAVVCAVATGSDSADALAHADVVFTSMTELPAWHAARYSGGRADNA